VTSPPPHGFVSFAAVGELDTTTGIVALAAGALALLALLLVGLLAMRLRRLRRAQRAVLGEAGEQDLVQHAHDLSSQVDRLSRQLEELGARTAERLDAAEGRLDRALSRASVIRYDAYDEMSGRQSSSIAILDDHGDGVVLSSILHREQARVYAKGVSGGSSELGISPEEREAIEEAMVRRADGAPPPAGG
jgi:Protein of unknown function (DUF4446)